MYKILFLILLILAATLNVNAQGTTKPEPKDETKPKPKDEPKLKEEISSTGLKFSGDLRLRWQGYFQSNRNLRSINQFRFRLSAASHINKYIDFGSRFISGNPALIGNGGDQALSDFFTRKTISIDQIYMNFRPEKHFNLMAGKFANPFLHTDLVWDDDVPFEGLSQSIKLSGHKSPNSLILNMGEFLLNKNGSEEGSYILGFQAATKAGLIPSVTLTFAAAVYDFINEDQIYISRKEGALKPTIKNIKNETNRSNIDQSVYLTEFRIVDLIGKISYMVGKFPVELVLDYAQNVKAKDENKGVWTTVNLGDVKSVKGIKASYNFFQIQSDAVVAAYNNFDYASTNVIGHGFVITYQPLKNTFIDLIAFFRKTKSVPVGKPNLLRTRVRLQVSVKF